MDEDPYGFGTYLLLGVVFLVLILMAFPPKYKDLKHLLLIVTAFLVLAVGGPFHIKSIWDKYHDFDSGRTHKIRDNRRTLVDYQTFGPKGPAITASLIYIMSLCVLGACARAQYRKWRYNESW